MSGATSGFRFVRRRDGHAGAVIRVIRTNRTVRAVLAAMALFVVVAAIWAGVGYVYADDRKAESATTVGLCVLGAGWLAILGAVAVKFLRLRARRRDSTPDS
ncbi:MAG: hypothetical protein WBD41_00825 [Rhodococcus sp. (in: high G+C Gram-positive bacteria)]|uniref:hypothetical protein n=1 Tax=Rhodococcus sp. EPR-157 TaxID=1813677 RepID=UPI000A466B6D|nr:hypothetical protein [Rhodococcus sp. EPR-157]